MNDRSNITSILYFIKLFDNLETTHSNFKLDISTFKKKK